MSSVPNFQPPPPPPDSLSIDDNGERCSICYEVLYGEVTVLPCDTRHKFHGTCIRQWCLVNSTCPLDRVRIPPEVMVPLWNTSIGIRFYISRFLIGVTHGASLWINVYPLQPWRYIMFHVLCSVESFIFARVLVSKSLFLQQLIRNLAFVGLMARAGFGNAAALQLFRLNTARLMKSVTARSLAFLNRDYDYEVLSKMPHFLRRNVAYLSGVFLGGLVVGRVVSPILTTAFNNMTQVLLKGAARIFDRAIAK